MSKALKSILLAFAVLLAGLSPSLARATDRCVVYPKAVPGGIVLVNSDGSVVSKQKFDDAQHSSGELIPVKSGGKWGYVDCAGQWIIPAKYTGAEECHDGICRVEVEYNEFGLIDTHGKTLPFTQFNAPYLPSDGRVVGMYDHSIAGVQADDPGYLTEHMYGVADLQGTLVTKESFAMGTESSYSEGLLAACRSENRCGFVDEDGHWQIKPDYIQASSFSGGLARVYPKQHVVWFIQHDGKRAFSTDLTHAWDFCGDVAPASTGDAWGLIDKTGRFVLQPRFEFIGLCKAGRAIFEVGNLEGVIDFQGNVVVPAIYDQVILFDDGSMETDIAGGQGYKTRDGKPIVDLGGIEQYSSISKIIFESAGSYNECYSFTLEMNADGSADLTAECPAAKAPPTAMSRPGDGSHKKVHYHSTGNGRLFRQIAQYISAEDLADFDGHRMGYAFDKPYSTLIIETASRKNQMLLGENQPPSVRILQMALVEASRDIKWDEKPIESP